MALEVELLKYLVKVRGGPGQKENVYLQNLQASFPKADQDLTEQPSATWLVKMKNQTLP